MLIGYRVRVDKLTASAGVGKGNILLVVPPEARSSWSISSAEF